MATPLQGLSIKTHVLKPIACTLFLAILLSACSSEPTPPPKKSVNVLWIALDACRANNLSSYGNPRNTSPNIDALAKQGVAFKKNYSQAAYTTLSVPSYMTGRYFPTPCLFNSPWNSLWLAPPKEEKLAADIFASNGYDTWMITSHPWMDDQSRLAKSFKTSKFVSLSIENRDLAYERIGALTEQALAWIENRKSSSEPFFMYLHAMDTHFPHILAPPFDKWTPEDVTHPELATYLGLNGQKQFDEKDQQYLKSLHDGSILFADTALGIFFEELRGSGVLENTIVVIGADHGDALGEDGKTVDHPANVYPDELLHVPLILAGPGIPAGKSIEMLTENVDIVPTLVDLLQLQTNARFDGKSLNTLMQDQTPQPIHDYTFAKYQGFGMPDYGIILRFDDFKYVDNRLVPRRIKPNAEEFWSVPDSLVGQKLNQPQQVSEATVKAAREALEKDIQPRWNAFKERPLTNRVPFEELLSLADVVSSKEHYLKTADSFHRPDGKWSLRSTLVSAPNDNAPPITLRFNVPNWQYRVQLLVHLQAKEKVQFPDKPTFLYSAQDQKERKELYASTGSRGLYYDLGLYTVTADTFTLTLEEGDTARYNIASKLRFIPITEDAQDTSLSVQGEESHTEQLRALGYID